MRKKKISITWEKQQKLGAYSLLQCLWCSIIVFIRRPRSTQPGHPIVGGYLLACAVKPVVENGNYNQSVNKEFNMTK